MDTTRPRGVGPVVARLATRHRGSLAVVVRHATRGREISVAVARPRPMVARSQPSSPARDPWSPDLNHTRLTTTCGRPIQQPSLPDPAPVVARIFLTFVPVVARCILVVACCGPVVGHCVPVIARCGPATARCTTLPALAPHPSAPGCQLYKYACVFSFLCTLSEHPGLHLPRRLLAGFSTGCFTFFIARHPPPLSHPLQVLPLWYNPLNGGNRTEAFNLALARVTMHQPHMGHTHVRSALNLLCYQSKLGTYPLSPLVHPLVDRGWLGADFHTCPRPS